MGSYSRIKTGRKNAAIATGRVKPARPAARRSGATTANTIVNRITACIDDLRAAGFDETAEMLVIARLDLLVRLNGVSDAEIDAFIEVIAGRRPV